MFGHQALAQRIGARNNDNTNFSLFPESLVLACPRF
jgi:hypothetical protein